LLTKVTTANNSKCGNKGSLRNKDVRKFRLTEKYVTLETNCNYRNNRTVPTLVFKVATMELVN